MSIPACASPPRPTAPACWRSAPTTMFSAARLFQRLRAWAQARNVSPIGWRNYGVPAGSADARGRAGNDAHAQPDAVRRHPDPVRGAARQSLHYAGCRLQRLRRCISAGEALPADTGAGGVDRRGRYPRRNDLLEGCTSSVPANDILWHQWKAGAGV